MPKAYLSHNAQNQLLRMLVLLSILHYATNGCAGSIDPVEHLEQRIMLQVYA